MDKLNPWFTVGMLVFAVYIVLALLGSRDRPGDSTTSKRTHRAPQRTRRGNS
jgi:hypothetical protein